MRSSSFLLSLALVGCTTASSEFSPAPKRTLWIENRTPDALVVRVDGVRVATVFSHSGACIALPAPGQRLTARAIGRRETYPAPTFIGEQSLGWNWNIRMALGSPGSTLHLLPAEPCRVR
ncbi:MAG TPA: hypothetical protein VFS20_22265 [Longimicrobium sp.]|nr:hypothetical protein [Longimicrobium sp.]